MDATEQLSMATGAVTAIAGHLEDHHLGLPLERGGSVRDALDRLATMGAACTTWMRGGEHRLSTAPPRSGGCGADASEVLRSVPRVAAELRAAASAPGASERQVHTPMGAMTGRQLAAFATTFFALHAHELATATGAPGRGDPDRDAA